MEKNNSRILIVDDEPDLREILQFNLAGEGFEIQVAASAEEALKLPVEDFDLILLDVMMGGISGYQMAEILRKERTLETPIIFLTAKGTENDLLTGFNVGGDDYIVKPFSVKEVIARIKAVLKRGQTTGQSASVLSSGNLTLDHTRKLVTLNNHPIELTRKEFEILFLLMKNKGKYISRQQILYKVWNDEVIVTERNVDVNIARLRKKIKPYDTVIKSRTGYGYCFND